MDKFDDIDVRKLERCFNEADAVNRSLYTVIDQLREDNKHLRDVIDSLLLTIQSFGNINVHSHESNR